MMNDIDEVSKEHDEEYETLIEYVIDAKSGNKDALNSIIIHLERYIKYAVNQWRNSNPIFEKLRDFEDDFQDACMCCEYAVDKFEFDKGSKFTSFFFNAIKMNFKNLKRMLTANKRETDIYTSYITKSGSGENDDWDITIPVDSLHVEELMAEEFTKSLDTKQQEILRRALDGEDVEDEIFDTGIKRMFLDYYPEHKDDYFNKQFEKRMEIVIEMLKFEEKNKEIFSIKSIVERKEPEDKTIITEELNLSREKISKKSKDKDKPIIKLNISKDFSSKLHVAIKALEFQLSLEEKE